MPAMLQRWRTAIRDSEKSRVTHVGVSDDTAAYAIGQTTLNPTGGATTALVKAATKTDVDANTFDAVITVNGSTEFTGKVISTIGVCDGPAATNALSRSVRAAGLGIGVQAGDTFSIGVRVTNADNS